MTASNLFSFLRSIPKHPQFSILLRAKHGVGKSSIIKQFAEEKKLHFIDIRLGQRDVGDIIGFPINEDGKFKHILPELLAPAFNKPSLLFFDELNRGTKDVQQAVFEIILDRRMNGKILHPETLIVSAINQDLNIYSVTDIDPALLSRFCAHN